MPKKPLAITDDNESAPGDGCRNAASAQLEAIAVLAKELAVLLGSDVSLPADAVGAVLVLTGKHLVALKKARNALEGDE